MADILLVEDDSTLALGIEYSLKNESFNVKWVRSLKESREALAGNSYGLIILDVMLPDGNGYDFCREVRTKSNVPIVFLTACDEEVNIVLGLDLGGDDYITKPFRIKELMSRIRAVLRRHNVQILQDRDVLSSGEIMIYTLNGKVMKCNNEIFVTALEYKLLLTFIKHPKQVLTRNAMLDSLWDVKGEFVDDNTLSVYIRRLREKVEEDPAKPIYIKTVRGFGYKWDMEVRGH